VASFDQPACDQCTGVSRDEVLCEAVDKLLAAVVAVMSLLAMVQMAVLLVLGRLTLWTHLSDDHRWLLSSAGVANVVGPQEHGIAWRALHGVPYHVLSCSQ
jgi:hypothetical protein